MDELPQFKTIIFIIVVIEIKTYLYSGQVIVEPVILPFASYL